MIGIILEILFTIPFFLQLQSLEKYAANQKKSCLLKSVDLNLKTVGKNFFDKTCNIYTDCLLLTNIKLLVTMTTTKMLRVLLLCPLFILALQTSCAQTKT